MRHGFADDAGNGIIITAADQVAFVNADVARLVEMIQPQWLEDNQRRSPTRWLVNSKFELAQAIESARFFCNGGGVDEATRTAARQVIADAKALLAQLEAQ